MVMSTRQKRQNILSSPPQLSTTSITTKSSILSDDIFNRLPQKTLIKLCIVCKSWLDIIANPRRSDSIYSLRLKANPSSLNLLAFFCSHSLNIRCKPLIFSSLNLDSTNTYPLLLQNVHLSSLYDDPTIKVDASSNGYILCHRCYHDQYDLSWLWFYYVINPFTKEWLYLPMIKASLFYGICDYSVGFRCEVDSTSPLAAAHFTVVLANISVLEVELRVLYSHHRYNLPAFQWRRLVINLDNRPGLTLPTWKILPNVPRGVILDDVFYCIHKHDLKAVDLRRGRANKVKKLPYNASDMTNYTMLGVFENKLYFGYQDYNDMIVRVFVYEGNLDRGRGYWVLKYTMHPEKLVRLNGFHPKNPAIFFFNIFNYDLMSYDARTKSSVVRDTYDDSYLHSFIPCELSVWPHSLPLVKHH